MKNADILIFKNFYINSNIVEKWRNNLSKKIKQKHFLQKFLITDELGIGGFSTVQIINYLNI